MRARTQNPRSCLGADIPLCRFSGSETMLSALFEPIIKVSPQKSVPGDHFSSKHVFISGRVCTFQLSRARRRHRRLWQRLGGFVCAQRVRGLVAGCHAGNSDERSTEGHTISKIHQVYPWFIMIYPWFIMIYPWLIMIYPWFIIWYP